MKKYSKKEIIEWLPIENAEKILIFIRNKIIQKLLLKYKRDGEVINKTLFFKKIDYDYKTYKRIIEEMIRVEFFLPFN